MLFGFLDFQGIDIMVDTSCFLESGNSASHPVGAAGKLIVRSKGWPVKSIFQRYKTVDSSYHLSVKVLLAYRSRQDIVTICVAVGMTVCIAVAVSV